MAESAGIHLDRGGSGDGLLVLLHGLGATAGVWSRFSESASGRWIAPDLPGHGGSAPLPSYRVTDYTDALAPVLEEAAEGQPITLLGHSLGGVIALALAARLERVERVFALGVKVDWSQAELDRMQGLATKPPRTFATEAEALAFHARLAGLEGVASGSPLLARGARQDGNAWRASMDARAFGIEAPDMAALLDASSIEVHLAAGEQDDMAPVTSLSRFGRPAATIAGAGHNAMVDRPDQVWAWMQARR